MRNAFVKELVKEARLHPEIFLIVGDLGYSVVEPFAEEFPERFINAGVAEQNMMGLASGLASEGYHVFVYSIANFPTFRCAEQIRNDVAYHELPVTIVTVGGGVAYGALGYSHHAVQDYALMRVLPNVLIASPGDPAEVCACLDYLVENPGPSYLRLGKTGEIRYHETPPNLKRGRWVNILKRDGNRKAFLCTGASLQVVMEWVKRRNRLDLDVFSLPLWSMSEVECQLEFLSRYDQVITVEDHLCHGGFGSWLLEANSLSVSNRCDVKVVGLDPLVCGLVASQSQLHELGGLNLDRIGI